MVTERSSSPDQVQPAGAAVSAVPRVACLTPHEVMDPVYRLAAASMPAHVLVTSADRDAAALHRMLSAATVIIGDWTGRIQLTAADIAAARQCVAIVQPTSGYNCIDIGAARRAGITVANVPGANASAVAEWVVMAALLSLKEVPRFHREVREGFWPMIEAARAGVFELRGRTVGIVGLGRIGVEVARRLVPFEPRAILYADAVAVPEGRAAELRLNRVSLAELFLRSDVVTLHVPLTDSTRHLVGTELLDLLGPDGVLINTSRGAVVDSGALRDALTSGRLKAAALDVFDSEPLGPGHPWAGLPNVLLSPHLAGSTNESRERMIRCCLDNVARALRGEPLRNVI